MEFQVIQLIVLAGLLVYQIHSNDRNNKRYLDTIAKQNEILDRNTEVLHNLKEAVVHQSAADRATEVMLQRILDKLD